MDNLNDNLNEKDLNRSQTIGKYIDPECYNEDFEESKIVEKVALELKPYFSPSSLPTALYLKNNVLQLVFEALTEVEKIRPKDPIEFFAAYLLERNKKEIKLINA
jgi:hypothetical protein